MTDTVQEALAFTEDDLVTNRAGLLSQTQQARLGNMRRRAGLISGLTLFIIALLASGLIFLAQRDSAPLALLAGLGLTVINAVIMARAVQTWLRIESDLRSGQVEILEGTVKRTVRVVGRALIYILTIEGRELVVSKAVFNGVPDETRWRFYRSLRSGTLLAAEPVSSTSLRRSGGG